MLLSKQPAPSMYWCMGLYLPRCWTLHFGTLHAEEKTCFYCEHDRALDLAAQSSCGLSVCGDSHILMGHDLGNLL